MAVTVFVGETSDTSFASIGMMPMPPSKQLTATGLLAQVTTLIT